MSRNFNPPSKAKKMARDQIEKKWNHVETVHLIAICGAQPCLYNLNMKDYKSHVHVSPKASTFRYPIFDHFVSPMVFFSSPFTAIDGYICYYGNTSEQYMFF